MKPNAIIVRYGEISLKGKNRGRFEAQLKQDIEQQLKSQGCRFSLVSRQHGRIYVHGVDAAAADLKKVLGIYSTSPAFEIDKDYELLKKTAHRLLPLIGRPASFRVSCQRVDKYFFPDSMETEKEIGALIQEATAIPVNLNAPELNLQIEIGHRHIYIFFEKVAGFLGMPFGSAGKLVSLISGGIDSPVATFLMMKRGVRPVLLHYEIDARTTRKVEQIKRKLEEYAAGHTLKLIVVPRDEIFAGKFNLLFKSHYQDYLCLICKFLMHRRASDIARRERALGVITGDNLAQVASQTLTNLLAQRSAGEFPVYSPLIAYEKRETIELARRIGTYDLSIEATPGCTPPPHPKTRVTRQRLEAILRETGFLD